MRCPVNTLTHPAETGVGQTTQRFLPLARVIILFKLDGDAQERGLAC